MSAIKTFFKKLWADLNVLWVRYEVFAVFAALGTIAYFFRDLLMDFLLKSEKKDAAIADQKSQALSAKEIAANDQANDLISKANSLTQNEMPVDENWNKK